MHDDGGPAMLNSPLQAESDKSLAGVVSVLVSQRAQLRSDLARLEDQIRVSLAQLRTLASLKPEIAPDYLTMAEELEASFVRVESGLLETIARLDRAIEAKQLN